MEFKFSRALFCAGATSRVADGIHQTKAPNKNDDKSQRWFCVCVGNNAYRKLQCEEKKRGLGEWDGRASEWKRAKYFYKSEIVSNIRGWRCFPQNRKGRVMSEFVSVSDFNATEIGRHLFVPHFSASHLNHTIFFFCMYAVRFVPRVFFVPHSFEHCTFSLLAQNICSICYLSFI